MIRFNSDHELHSFTSRDNPELNWQEKHPVGTSFRREFRKAAWRKLTASSPCPICSSTGRCPHVLDRWTSLTAKPPIFVCVKCKAEYPALGSSREPLPLDELLKRRQEWLQAAERNDGSPGKSKREMDTSIAYFSGLGCDRWEIPDESLYDVNFRTCIRDCKIQGILQSPKTPSTEYGPKEARKSLARMAQSNWLGRDDVMAVYLKIEDVKSQLRSKERDQSRVPKEVWVNHGGVSCLTQEGPHVAGLSTYDPQEIKALQRELKDNPLRKARELEEILKRACVAAKVRSPEQLLPKLEKLLGSSQKEPNETS